MKDETGNLITNQDKILELTLSHYKNVLRNRPINNELKEYQEEREKLATLRMKEASNNKTPDWTLTELEDVLKGLKKDKCRDPFGYINKYSSQMCAEMT